MGAKPATLFLRACSTGKPEIIRSLLREGLSPDTRDSYGPTGLIWTGRKGQIEAANALLEGGCDLNLADRRGRTALFHGVCFKRYEFVQHLATRGADRNTVDVHGLTPLDYASSTGDAKMVGLLKKLGAQRKSTQDPEHDERWNSFGTGGVAGGPDQSVKMSRIRVQLNGILHQWKGNYTRVVRMLYFPMYEDGAVVRCAQEMGIVGAQPAQRKGDWIEVKIGIPESWWGEGELSYKERLTNAIEEGLHSMIALLKRNKHPIEAELLLSDWETRKKLFLDSPAPPYPAEQQSARLAAMVAEAKTRLGQ
ncbi:MAG TPA: ankyrin repeat domain-containing protein [Acidobacteriaceae bacterium]|jgi:hypothetical protein